MIKFIKFDTACSRVEKEDTNTPPPPAEPDA